MCLINGDADERLRRQCSAILTILIVSSIFLFTYLCWLRHKALFNYEYIDLAEIINISWNTAQGRVFYQTINPNPYGIFILHIQPAILFISLFFIIFRHPVSLYIGFNFALAVAAVPLFMLARDVLRNNLVALSIAVSYLLYAPLKSMYLLSDPDPVLLAVPCIFSYFYFLTKKNFKMCLIFALLILSCGEYLGLLVSMLGIYALVSGANRRLGACLMIGGIIYTFLAAHIITAAGLYNKQSLYSFLENGSFVKNLSFIIFHPVNFFRHILDFKHLSFLAGLLKPLLFLPLFSAELYVGLPVFFQIFLCHRAIEFGRAYYAAPLVPVMFIAAVFFLKRIKRQWLIFTLALFVLASCVYSNFGPNILGYLREEKLSDRSFYDAKNIYGKRFYRTSPKAKTAWKFINLIPPQAPVMATADLCAALAMRKTIYYFPYPYAEHDVLRDEKVNLKELDRFLEKVEYLLLNLEYKGYGAGSYPSFSLSEFKRVSGYLIDSRRWRVILQEEGFVLLEKNES